MQSCGRKRQVSWIPCVQVTEPKKPRTEPIGADGLPPSERRCWGKGTPCPAQTPRSPAREIGSQAEKSLNLQLLSSRLNTFKTSQVVQLRRTKQSNLAQAVEHGRSLEPTQAVLTNGMRRLARAEGDVHLVPAGRVLLDRVPVVVQVHCGVGRIASEAERRDALCLTDTK